MSSAELISIKELASKLKVTDALLKKLIKDFDISTDRVEKRIYLNTDSVTTVRAVLALRASGKKNKEIKELFEASKTATAVQEEPVVTKVETEATKPKADLKKAKPILKKAKPKKTDETEVLNETEEQAAQIPQAEKISEETIVAVAKEYEDSQEHSVDISSYLEEDQDAENEPSMAMRLAEETGIHHDEAESTEDQSLMLEDHDGGEDEAPIAREPERVTERTQDRLNPRKMRRRQFSFSYIQRQIANDSKRIQYLQQKIKRGSLSTKEEMNLKDSLEHRSKLLSGWVHLLRWVKS